MTAAAACMVLASSISGATEAAESTDIEGLWAGAWGGGEDADGAVFQPVLAELLVQGDRIELHGFRNVGNLAGTVRVDSAARRIQIIRADQPPDEAKPSTIDYEYEISGETLTLTDSDRVPIVLNRYDEADPAADVQVLLVAAAGIDEAGDLVVTEFRGLLAGRADTAMYRPELRRLRTREAAVFVVQGGGWEKIDIDRARTLVRPPAAVAVAYRHDRQPLPYQSHTLWQVTGPAAPDSDAALRTLSQCLRDGTLVFVFDIETTVVP